MYHIDKTSEYLLCSLCDKKGESVQNLGSDCEKLALREYKRRLNNVAKKVDWNRCEKNEL